MSRWESQIRTNLADGVYAQCLGNLLKVAPGTLRAALVNTCHGEAQVSLAGGGQADEQMMAQTIDLACGLFAPRSAPRPGGSAGQLNQVRPLKFALLVLRGEKVLMQWLAGGRRVLVVTVADSLNLGAAQTQLLRAMTAIGAANNGSLRPVLEVMGEILAAAVVDVEQRALLDSYRRYDGVSIIEFDEASIRLVSELFSQDGPIPALRLSDRKGGELEAVRAQLTGETRTQYWARLPFDPEHLVTVMADQKTIQGLVWIAINQCVNNVIRIWVDGLLNYGIDTIMAPFPHTQAEFLAIVDDLGNLDRNDLMNRLIIGGFANHTIGAGEGLQRCQECIYYLPHAKWCDLPELPIPVEPHWWCRLWKM